jgi:hypothetical protein
MSLPAVGKVQNKDNKKTKTTTPNKSTTSSPNKTNSKLPIVKSPQVKVTLSNYDNKNKIDNKISALIDINKKVDIVKVEEGGEEDVKVTTSPVIKENEMFFATKEEADLNAAIIAKELKEEKEKEELASKELLEAEEKAAIAAARKIEFGNGEVIIKYEQYDERFPIIDGSTTSEIIDDVYCLSFVMPDCLIHLSFYDSKEKRRLEDEGNLDIFIKEDPIGKYHDLEKENIYYCYIEQKADQLKRDQLKMQQVARVMDNPKTLSREQEGCSCLFGNVKYQIIFLKTIHNSKVFYLFILLFHVEYIIIFYNHLY